MGVSFSCPFADQSDVENRIESVTVKSISLGDDDAKTPRRSVSFNSCDSDPMVMKPLECGAIKIEGSISLETKELETVLSFKAPSTQEENLSKIKQIDEMIQRYSALDPSSPKHKAALKLQKVYKSFRTRRKLADCAVLVEQSWWKLLDFAELKRSSVSFFDMEKHETAISRWSRARTRAAKVGKGLSKNDKAQKLALQHWLEAIDPRHRYGHNLHFYYASWLNCQSREPFFYWLDIGEGREVNLVEECPRSKLQQQCIKYLGPMEREVYEVVVEDGKFLYKQTRELLHTTGDAKCIFVLSTSKTLYVGRKKKGTFQHSSFLAGGATMAAGRLVVDSGILKAVWPHSGHYRPTEENFKDFVSFLEENNVDISHVKMSPVDVEEESLDKQTSLKNNSSEEDLSQQMNVEDLTRERMDPMDLNLSRKVTDLQIGDCPEIQDSTFILRRINSHKGTKSYQLGKQLSCKWTTGAGPRIWCVRDYPAELQCQALEQVSLSPKSSILSRSHAFSTSKLCTRSAEEVASEKEVRSINHSTGRTQ